MIDVATLKNFYRRRRLEERAFYDCSACIYSFIQFIHQLFYRSRLVHDHYHDVRDLHRHRLHACRLLSASDASIAFSARALENRFLFQVGGNFKIIGSCPRNSPRYIIFHA